MKNKISLITLIACAAAGTTFAADPVEAFRASSGTTTNSADATYVGNPVWASDAQQIGEKYVADLLSKYAPEDSFEWDSELNAFCQDETGYRDDDPTHHGGSYRQINAVFALTGTAQFTNAADATMSFRCESETAEHYSGYDPERKEYFTVNCDNLILFADSSKFTNEGTISYESYFTGTAGGTYEDWNSGKPIDFSVFLRDDAVFENAGTISAEPNNYVEYVSYNLFGNAKFVNAASGKIRGIDLCLYGDSVVENEGLLDNSGLGDKPYVTLQENAKFVNTGTIVGETGYNFEFAREMTGTSKIENRGKMTNMSDVTFMYWLHGDETLSGVSATFENRGEISAADEYGVHAISFEADFNFENESDVDFIAVGKANLAASDLNVKNYGTISAASIILDSGVKLTLGEGSNIDGNVAIGSQIRYYQGRREFRLDKDVLNIVLTGKGGSDALISGGLEVCNLVELNVSLAEDAVKKTKYELTIWGGELTLDEKDWIYDPETGEYIQVPHDSGFIKTTGTLEGFGTTYTWNLDTATGVLTAKDVNIDKEIALTSPTQNVELGEKDVATLDPSLTEYSGNVSGAGQVSSSGDVEFSGDASELTGTLSVDAGTFTVAEGAKLGEKATLDVTGTLALEGDRTIANATSGDGIIELAAGATVKFAEEVGVKTLNVSDGATLSGGVSLTHAEAVLNLAGTLALNADAGEKVTLGGGKVVLASTAKLDLGGNAASGAAQTQTLFADATNASSALEHGATVTIFENGTVEGDVVAFLATDSKLSALASQYAVIYDKTNGLTVQALTNPEALANRVDTSDLSSSFVGWALGGLADELANLQPGFVAKDDLGGLDSNDPLLNALLAGDAGTARSILDRLSPKSYAAMIAMPVETFHDDARNVSARLAQRRFEKFVADAPWEFFAQAQMISVENDTASDAPTFDFDRYGALAGADVKLDETMLLGVAVGAGTGDADIHNGGGKIESTDFRALAYFGKTFAERFYVNAGAQIGFSSYDVKRRSDYGDANAEVDGWNAGAFAEAGAAFAISETHGLYATPYVGLAYAHAETDSFTESGSDRAAFDADALEGDSLRARIGCAFSWDFALASTAVRLGLDVAYSRELLDDEIDVDVRSGSDEISETAAALPEDVFSIGPTLDVALTASASVYAGYAFQAGTDSSTAHRANVGFRLRF